MAGIAGKFSLRNTILNIGNGESLVKIFEKDVCVEIIIRREKLASVVFCYENVSLSFADYSYWLSKICRADSTRNEDSSPLSSRYSHSKVLF